MLVLRWLESKGFDDLSINYHNRMIETVPTARQARENRKDGLSPDLRLEKLDVRDDGLARRLTRHHLQGNGQN